MREYDEGKGASLRGLCSDAICRRRRRSSGGRSRRRCRRRSERSVCLGREVERFSCELEHPAAEVLSLAEEARVASCGYVNRTLDPRLGVAGTGSGLIGGVEEGEEDGLELERGFALRVLEGGKGELTATRSRNRQFEVGGRDGVGPRVGFERLYDCAHLTASLPSLFTARVCGVAGSQPESLLSFPPARHPHQQPKSELRELYCRAILQRLTPYTRPAVNHFPSTSWCVTLSSPLPASMTRPTLLNHGLLQGKAS
jgi:hypothetical protein